MAVKKAVASTKRLHLDKRVPQIMATMPETVSEGEPQQLLTTKQVALWWGVSTQWLEGARLPGRDFGPPYIVVGPNMVRYRKDVLLQWLEARQHRNTNEYRQRKAAATWGKFNAN